MRILPNSRSTRYSPPYYLHSLLSPPLTKDQLIRLGFNIRSFLENKHDRQIQELLKLTDCNVNAMSAVMVDLFCQLIWRAKEAKLNVLQTSAFASLFMDLINNIKDKHMDLEANTDYFKQVMRKHSTLTRWDGVSPLPDFDGVAVPVVTTYIRDTIFQHYRLYFHVFTTLPAEEVHNVDVLLRTPLQPPPLSEAVPAVEIKRIHNPTRHEIE
eukprot:m.139123 g.139123  ORF g.139123 m.139123 type:complete len:212 (-) comp15935_c0_seq3:96-731(-)